MREKLCINNLPLRKEKKTICKKTKQKKNINLIEKKITRNLKRLPIIIKHKFIGIMFDRYLLNSLIRINDNKMVEKPLDYWNFNFKKIN